MFYLSLSSLSFPCVQKKKKDDLKNKIFVTPPGLHRSESSVTAGLRCGQARLSRPCPPLAAAPAHGEFSPGLGGSALPAQDLILARQSHGSISPGELPPHAELRAAAASRGLPRCRVRMPCSPGTRRGSDPPAAARPPSISAPARPRRDRPARAEGRPGPGAGGAAPRRGL